MEHFAFVDVLDKYSFKLLLISIHFVDTTKHWCLGQAQPKM